MKYRLFYKELELGTITQTGEDFPNLFGSFNSSGKAYDELLTEYIAFSIEADKLMAKDEEEWQDFIDAEEHKFLELIESEDWSLIDEKANTRKIMIPNFCDNSEIAWRWDF